MRSIFSIAFLLCTQWLLAQINSLSYQQGFEEPFVESSNVEFIPHWLANEVSSNKRVFQGTDARSGAFALHVIPTSSFTAEIKISMDLRNYKGALLSFYAFAKQNGSASATRPALLEISTSIDGGNNFIGVTAIGDENTFPNNDLTSYQPYQYELPPQAGQQPEVLIKIKVSRGVGVGSAAELVMDDFLIEERTPPLSIVAIEAQSPTKLAITFNQDLEKSSVENTANYRLNYDYGAPLSAELDANNNATVILTMGKALVNNNYELTATQITNRDKSETAASLNFSFKHTIQTAKRALVINEIYADPNGDYLPDSVALPSESSAEYIELYNTTREYIDISNFSLSESKIGTHVIGPNEYLILSSANYSPTYELFGPTIALAPWNSLNNSGETILLYDQLGHVVDSLSYDISWYNNADKATGAWSLEQINPDKICSNQQNWAASQSQIGGTPGRQNSLFNNAPDTLAPSVSAAQIISPTKLKVKFSELMDQSCLESGAYGLTPDLSIINIATHSTQLDAVLLSLADSMTSGTTYTVTVNGARDCAGNEISHNSFSFHYDNIPPQLLRIAPKSKQWINLVYDEALDAGLVNDESNYSLNNDLGSPKKSTINQGDSIISLIFDGDFELGRSYEITIANMADSLGNTSEKIISDFTFEDAIDSIAIITNQLLDIYFKDSPNGSSENTSNYLLDRGIGKPVSAIIDSENSKLIHLSFDQKFPENKLIEIAFRRIQNLERSFLSTLNQYFIYDTRAPQLISYEVSDENSLKLKFDEPLDQSSAEAINHYEVNEGFGRAQKAELLASDSSVLLSFSKAFLQEKPYRLSYSFISDIHGNSIQSAKKLAFSFDTLAPRVERLKQISPKQIMLTFNEALVDSLAENTAHFSIDHAGPIKEAIKQDSAENVIILHFDQLESHETNVLRLNRQSDALGNQQQDTLAITFDNLKPQIGQYWVHSDTSIAIQFTHHMEALSVEDVNNYLLNDVIHIKSALLQNDPSLLYLTFSESFRPLIHNRLSISVLKNTEGHETGSQNLIFTYENGIESIRFASANSLLIAFKEAMDEASVTPTVNYMIEALGKPITTILEPDHHKQVTLVWTENFEASKPYELQISGLKTKFLKALPFSRHSLLRDVVGPKIMNVSTPYANEIALTFDEPLDMQSALALNHYFVSDSIGNPSSIQFLENSQNTLLLTFERPFINEQWYDLKVKRIKDVNGNVSKDSLLSFKFQSLLLPQFRDLVINEVYFDIDASGPLPAYEYIELYNRSAQNFELRDFKITDEKDTAKLPQYAIAPNAYLVLSKPSGAAALNGLGLSNFPSLSNAGETIWFLDRKNQVIDSLSYDKSLYNDVEKEDGGYSLELINPKAHCFDDKNYGGSSGTPGSINALFSDAKDLLSPEVLSFQIVNDSTLSFSFSEAMDLKSLIAPHFDLSAAIPIHSIDIKDPFGYHIWVILERPFEEGLFHSITLSAIKDCAGNLLATRKFEFPIGSKASKYDLIITEVMAIPSPSRGLPAVEYVEILNTSEKLISLKGVVLADKVSASHLKDSVLSPGDYLVLMPATSQDKISGAMALTNWPSLNNDRETLTLFNGDLESVFSLSYDKSWYRSSIKSAGGYSLEMIDINYPCVEAANWTSSESEKGGSPGSLNSVNGNNPDLQGPKLISAFKMDLGSIRLVFSEKLDAEKVSLSDFVMVGEINFLAYSLSPNGKEVLLYTDADLEINRVYAITVDNITDCSGNLINPDFSQIELIIPAEAKTGDIIVNEVLFKPRTGGARFVEFYNNSDKYINLKTWRIAGISNSKPLVDEDYIMRPHEFLIVTNDLFNIKQEYPKALITHFIELSSMPSMPSDKGSVILQDATGQQIDGFDYDEAMHSPLLNSSKGVSLERLKYDAPVQDPNNWFSAASTANYATPGYVNSQAYGSQTTAEELAIDPPVFAPDVSGAANYTTINLSFDITGHAISVTIFDVNGNRIKRLVENKLVGQAPFFKWDGTRDDGRKARIGYYMVIAEIITAEGEVKYRYGKVAIGTKF